MKKTLIISMFLFMCFSAIRIPAAYAAQVDVDLMKSLIQATALRNPTYSSAQLADELFLMYYDYRRLANACAALHSISVEKDWVKQLVESDDISKPFCELRQLRQWLFKLAGESAVRRLDDRIPNLGWLPGSGVSEVPCDPLEHWYGVVGDFVICETDS